MSSSFGPLDTVLPTVKGQLFSESVISCISRFIEFAGSKQYNAERNCWHKQNFQLSLLILADELQKWCLRCNTKYCKHKILPYEKNTVLFHTILNTGPYSDNRIKIKC